MIPFFNKQRLNNLQESKLFDETSFYKSFIQDLLNCREEVIIECPYITSTRMSKLLFIFKELLSRGITIYVITRDPEEHNEDIRHQATNEMLECKDLGINIVLVRGNHHRKLAILDREILWEGSLNILSYIKSREVMRRVQSRYIAIETINFIKKRL